MIVQIRFTHEGVPKGRDYAYFAPDDIKPGDEVFISGGKRGVVTAVDLLEDVIEPFKEKVKTIEGIIKEEKQDGEHVNSN